MRLRSFLAWVPRSGGPGESAAPPPAGWRTWRRDGLTLWYAPRDRAELPPPGDTLPPLVVGDDSEYDAAAPEASLAGGVPIRWDERSRALHIVTSIVALPPVYLHRSAAGLAITSDIESLTRLPGVHLAFDARGVTELGRFGHPVEHRTLWRDVELVPGGGRLAVGRDGNTSFLRTWNMPEAPPLDRAAFIEAQIAAFTDAMRRTDVSRSFLSLTAGLDTRSVFATLADQQRLVPGVTMTGTRRSLDARTAERLCHAYGVPHQLVTLDHAFRRALPRLMETASRLSGGLSSMGQAPEVFLYDALGGSYPARVSGNLGNQVGRGGTEGVSVRGADLGILDARLRSPGPGGEHWLLDHLRQDGRGTTEFIITREIAFSSAGNYSIGNHFAAQQSPYASRALIDTLARKPAAALAPSGSGLALRLRDLRHRFLGESERVSFQRALVRRIGGPAASIPINWGWRAAGAPSPLGLAMGAATLAGMAARAFGLDDGVLRGPLALTGLPALHDFREARRWLRVDLREFALDTLGAQRLLEAGLFEAARLKRTLDDHFAGRGDSYETVTFALDLALAHQQFKV